MIHAYNELYLNDSQTSLANAVDYAINDCKMEPDWFFGLFVHSGFAREFEIGNLSVISGKSGVELVHDVLLQAYNEYSLPERSVSYERSPEYWAGWALAYYQWYYAKRFKDIFLKIPLSEIIQMYPLFHEMDLTNFCEEMEKRYNNVHFETKLKKIREASGMSQAELAAVSGIKLRSIQLYEQRVNNIDKAQTQILYKISRVLGCHIEDLLENPEQ